MISLPFMEQQIADIVSADELGADIPGCVVVREWDCESQSWRVLAEMTMVHFPHWESYGNVRAGYPYMISLSSGAPGESVWPPVW